MKNYSRVGYVRTITATVAIESGDVVASGAKAGVSTNTLKIGEVGEIVLGGVFELKKAAGLALVQGQVYDWDATAKQIVADGAGDFSVGEADMAALAGSDVGYILLNGLPYSLN